MDIKLRLTMTNKAVQYYYKIYHVECIKPVSIITTLLAIGDMQIKTTITYHFIPTGKAIIKRRDNKKHWQECEEIETLIHCQAKRKMTLPFWKTL